MLIRRDGRALGLQKGQPFHYLLLSTKALLLVKRALTDLGKMLVFVGLLQAICLRCPACPVSGRKCYPHNP
jgi:hypothetical protein